VRAPGIIWLCGMFWGCWGLDLVLGWVRARVEGVGGWKLFAFFNECVLIFLLCRMGEGIGLSSYVGNALGFEDVASVGVVVTDISQVRVPSAMRSVQDRVHFSPLPCMMMLIIVP
jgi:hypothetical protein